MISHLCYALAYLHSHQIVHRDVKPENLLVQINGHRIHCLKLADFGLAQVVQEPLYTICGTPTYVAPEILAEVGYGLKVVMFPSNILLQKMIYSLTIVDKLIRILKHYYFVSNCRRISMYNFYLLTTLSNISKYVY
jgi:serine/threonine protein kinase